MNKMNSYFQSKATTGRIALWYAFSNIFVNGLAFISTPIFTRLMSKTEYGQFSNFSSWESILMVIVTLDFTTSIARAKYDYNDNMETYLSSILLVSNLVTFVSYIIVEINKPFFESLFSMDIIYIRVMFLYIMFMPAFSYLQTKHRMYKKYRFFVAFAISSAILRTGTSVVLVLLLQDKLFGRIMGYVLPSVLMNISLWIYIVKKGRRIDWSCVKYAAAISIPLIPHVLSGILLGNSDRIMITRYVGAEANAMYTLAYQISLLANLLWTAMNQAWMPWLFDNIHNNKRNEIEKNSKLYLGVFSALIVGVLLITPEFMLILGGLQYYNARFVMPPVVMGCVFQFVYGMYVNLEIYEKKTAIISAGTVLAALLNVGLNAIFIPKYGYIAAAYTTLIGYFALFMIHFIIVRVKIKNLKDLYSKRFIFSILATLTLFSGGSLLLYKWNILRYLILILYIIVFTRLIIKNRTTIKKLLGLKTAVGNDRRV